MAEDMYFPIGTLNHTALVTVLGSFWEPCGAHFQPWWIPGSSMRPPVRSQVGAIL